MRTSCQSGVWAGGLPDQFDRFRILNEYSTYRYESPVVGYKLCTLSAMKAGQQMTNSASANGCVALPDGYRRWTLINDNRRLIINYPDQATLCDFICMR